MIVEELARAKVNLALHVLGRRADLYHEIDSIAAFADVADCLTFARGNPHAEAAAKPPSKHHAPSLEVNGPFARDVPPGDDNLILKAASALSVAYPGKIGPARITLEKNIPVASGLGGGSADAAATLRGLIKLFGVHCDNRDLSGLALTLGADVPVCLTQVASRMRGKGEITTPLAGFSPHPAVLVHPGVHLKTTDVFPALGLAPGASAFSPISETDPLSRCRNDLTAAAMRLAPVIGQVLAALDLQPSLDFARMSGSGSACFALFSSAAGAEAAARAIASAHPDWWVQSTILA